MNYYEHHIGDYAADTAHLSWDEDMAYSRLIRAYYKSESPIPADIKDACRLARAATPAQRKAVEAVLREFFVLAADGWHQKRCDEGIAGYRAKQEGASEKKQHDAERQTRARERRAALFEQLRSHGIVMSYKSTTAELESRLLDVMSQGGDVNGHALVTRDELRQVSDASRSRHASVCDSLRLTQTPDPDTRPSSKYSDTDVSDGKPSQPATPDEVIFGYGVPLLVSAGTPDKQARSFLGGLRKTHGDTALIDKLRACAAEKPLQPLEWLAAALPPSKSSRHAGFDKADYRKGVNADGSF